MRHNQRNLPHSPSFQRFDPFFVLLISYFLIAHHQTAPRSAYTIITVLPGPTSGNCRCGFGEPGVIVKHL